jgi:hypothetical protein
MKSAIKPGEKPVGNSAIERRRILRAASLWVFLFLGFLILRFVYISFGVGIPCPLHAITGLYCPGCGTFRAAGALLEGNIWQAVRYNALCVVLLPLIFVFCVRETFRYIRAVHPMSASRLEIVIFVVVIAVSVLYAIARNLPAFDILKPTTV